MRRPRRPGWFRRCLPNAHEVRHAVGCIVVVVAAWWLWNLVELGLTSLTDPDELSPGHQNQSASAASDQEIAGRASIVDGDTIDIHGERIRILDIDAPESRQVCTAADGTQWRCGQKASLALSDWVGARTVTCEPTRKDRYGRWLARCTVGGADLAKWLAEEGWAVPYRNCKCEVVREAVARARAAGAGL